MKAEIVIGFCSLMQVVHLRWAMAFKDQYLNFGRTTAMQVVGGVVPISSARNLAIHDAKALEATYLLLWDDDIIPQSATAVSHLISALDHNPQATLIGGVCAMRTPVSEPIVVKEPGKGANYDWQDGRIHRVYHTGSGFLLIRLADLEDIDVPTIDVDGTEVREYFRQFTGEPGDYLGSDDYALAQLMKENGKTWLVYGGVVCDHIDRKSGQLYRVQDLEKLKLKEK